LNVSRAIGAILVGLGAGLLVGMAVGAVLLASDDNSPTAAVGSEQSPSPTAAGTPTRSPVPEPKPAPTEAPEFDPCESPGLCEFLQTLDERLVAQDVDGVMELIEFVPIVCGSPESQLNEGTYPIECRDWPYDDPVPTAGYAPFDSQGFPTSRWMVREKLEAFITGRESDCNGDRDGIQRRVRVVVAPPDPKVYWNGEIAVLLGAPLDCQPVIETDSGQRYAFALRPNGAGVWQVEAITEVAFDRCEDSFYRYVGEIRYYPLGVGPPRYAGPRVCLNEES
jgi:hypothetical protein